MESTQDKDPSVYIASNATNEESNVCMARPLADKLDYSLSPMDGITAIGQVYMDLPIVHNRISRRFSWLRWPGSLRIYTARIDWAGVGIDYVEHGDRLHVIEIWFFRSNNPPKVDGVFDEPTDLDRYVVGCNADEDEAA